MSALGARAALLCASCVVACADDTPLAVEQLAATRPGMGVMLYDGGATFRVWAPFASGIAVTGDFNGWGRASLTGEGNGNFSGDVSGVRPGHRYSYIVRDRWGNETWKSDPRSQRLESSVGATIVHDPGAYVWRSTFTAPPRDEHVLYELHVGTFHDAPGGGPGTLRSAGARLDHLRDLGVTMIELMPIHEFPGEFSWGYNPAHPFAVESAYGAPDDLKWFIDEAHLRGIGVILDVVHNHYGPSDLPLWCFSGDCLGAGGEYFFTDWRARTPWGDTRPDYARPQVRDYIVDQTLMLLHEYRADGLRWDATKFIRTVTGDDRDAIASGWDLLRAATSAKNRDQPWKLMVAEDFGAGDAITAPTWAGGAGFDTQWAGEFVHPVRRALTAPTDSARDVYSVRDAITQRFNGQASTRVIYTESHDEVANGRQRLPEEIWPGNAASWASRKRSTLGAALLLTSPGVPLIFQGQEILEDGWFSAEDPIDWSKADRFPGITRLYRDLIRLRRDWFDNTRGLRGPHVNVFHLNAADRVLAYHRWDQGGPGDDVIVVVNLGARAFPAYTIGLPRPGLWYVRFNSDARVYSPDFGDTPTLDVWSQDGGRDGLPVHGTFALGPYSAVILSN